MTDRDDELAEAIRELSLTLRALREELESSSRRRRPPVRPPSPRELLRFADEVALPTIIAVLEANVRALEAFQRSLRFVRRERETRERAVDATETTRERADELRRTSLDRLDAALNELGRAISSEGSRDDRAHELLEEARTLRREVDQRLRDVADSVESTSGSARRIEIEDGPTDADNRSETEDDEREANADSRTDERDDGIDVDAELETLKDRYGPQAPDEDDDESEGTESEEMESEESDATDTTVDETDDTTVDETDDNAVDETNGGDGGDDVRTASDRDDDGKTDTGDVEGGEENT